MRHPLQVSYSVLKQQYLYNEEYETTVLVQTSAPEIEDPEIEQGPIAEQDGDIKMEPSDSDRQSLDVVVVLDISGSMSGQKLKLCRGTCDLLSKQLTSKDRMGMVVFGSEARVTQNLTQMDSSGKEKTKNMLASINAGGMTNLSGGLFQGINVLAGKHFEGAASSPQSPAPFRAEAPPHAPNQNRVTRAASSFFANPFGRRAANGQTRQMQQTQQPEFIPVATPVSESSVVTQAEAAAAVENDTSKSQEPRLQAILLLTDGNANRGIVRKDHLMSETHRLLNMPTGPSAARIFTFGYGSDHNSDMLRDLATEAANTAGAYFFVEDVQDVEGAFADCFGALSSITAQNIVLNVRAIGGTTLSSPMTKFRTGQLDPGSPAQASGDAYCITIPDIYEGESKNILLKIKLPKLDAPAPEVPGPESKSPYKTATAASAQAATAILNIDIEYTDAKQQSAQRCGPIVAHVARPAIITNEEMNEQVSEQLLRYMSAQEMENARKWAQQGDVAKGRAALVQMQNVLRKEKRQYKAKSNLADCLEQDLDEAIGCLSDVNEFQTRGQHQMRSKGYEYSYERNCTSKQAPVHDAQAGSKPNLSMPTAYFRTGKQKKTRSAWAKSK